jgi:pimeloyl-ACP methyl ester carboxylesterase
MPYVDLGEFTMFYTDEGDGPPVLCVHGWTCDGSDWSWQVPAFVPGHRVIAVDLRGHGRSTAPADGYGPLFFADDLAALLARLGTGPVVAMGHSMGGATVVALAVEHPELVRAVVSVDSAFGFDPAGLEGIAQFLDLLKAPGGNQVAREFFGRFYPAACPPHLPVLHARRVEAMDHGALWKSFEGLLVRSFGEKPDAERYLPRVQCPVLTFRAGTEDPQSVAQWERAQFPNPYSKSVAWEGTGHFLHQERPAEFNAILLAWLSTCRSRAGLKCPGLLPRHDPDLVAPHR